MTEEGDFRFFFYLSGRQVSVPVGLMALSRRPVTEGLASHSRLRSYRSWYARCDVSDSQGRIQRNVSEGPNVIGEDQIAVWEAPNCPKKSILLM